MSLGGDAVKFNLVLEFPNSGSILASSSSDKKFLSLALRFSERQITDLKSRKL